MKPLMRPGRARFPVPQHRAVELGRAREEISSEDEPSLMH